MVGAIRNGTENKTEEGQYDNEQHHKASSSLAQHAVVVTLFQRECNRTENITEKSNTAGGSYGVMSTWREAQQTHLGKRHLSVI